jgi:hypothetical protein
MTGTFEVFIPTWRRTDKLIKTLANSPELQKTATIVVRPEEENHYLDAGFNVMVLPEGYEGLGAARQYIMTNTTADYVWMLDDDLNNSNLGEILAYVAVCARDADAGIFGLGNHFMVNARMEKDGDWTRKGYAVAAWGLDRRKYLATGMNMYPWKLCADLYCYVGMQIAGYKVMISNQYTAKQGNQQDGGCNVYRDAEILHSFFYKLEETYPKYVKVNPSKVDRTWYKSVRIEWSKIHREIPRI